MTKAIIVDLDNTLFNIKHRLHYIQKPSGERDWESFHLAMDFDTLNEWCLHLIHIYRKMNRKIVIITGRNSQFRDLTKDQLERHNIPYDELYMREMGDRRPPSVVKMEIYQNELAKRFYVDFILDDNHGVCEAFSRIGIPGLRHIIPDQEDWD